MVTQDYDTDLLKAFVIKGNEALLKCEIPSFVADFVTVESWVDNEGNQYFSGTTNNYGKISYMKHVFFTQKIWSQIKRSFHKQFNIYTTGSTINSELYNAKSISFYL